MSEYLPFVPIAPGVESSSRSCRTMAGWRSDPGDYDTAPDIDVMAHGIEDPIADSSAVPTVPATDDITAPEAHAPA